MGIAHAVYAVTNTVFSVEFSLYYVVLYSSVNLRYSVFDSGEDLVNEKMAVPGVWLYI